MRRSTLTVAGAALAGALTVLAPPRFARAAATTDELLACQKTFESQIRSYTGLVSTKLLGCVQKLDECKLANEIDGDDPSGCIAQAGAACSVIPAKLDAAKASRAAKVILRCGLISFTELEQFGAGLGFFNVASSCSASNVNDLVDCVFNDSRCSTEKQAFIIDPRAQDSLTAGGVAGSFPCVGGP